LNSYLPDALETVCLTELTEVEQLEVYRAVGELVKNRLAKARRV